MIDSSNSLSEWVLLLFGALLGAAVGFQVGKSHAPPSDRQPAAVPQKTTTATQKANACDHTDTALRCVQYVSSVDARTIRVDVPNVPFNLGKSTYVRLPNLFVPNTKSRKECERIKAILAKKMVHSALSKASRIHLLDVSEIESTLHAKVQFDGLFLEDFLIGKGLGAKRSAKATAPNWCRFN